MFSVMFAHVYAISYMRVKTRKLRSWPVGVVAWLIYKRRTPGAVLFLGNCFMYPVGDAIFSWAIF